MLFLKKLSLSFWLRGFAAVLFVASVFTMGSVALAGPPPVVNPQSGSVGLTGTVNGPPPTIAATIILPPSGFTTTSIPITMSGTCSAGDFVSISDNNLFAGATTCTDGSVYTIPVDLFVGQNVLAAEISNALGEFGPVSNSVVYYYFPPSLTVPGSAGKQLFIQAVSGVAATSPGQPITRSITIVGGVAPYAVSFDWGDGQSSLSTVAAPGVVSATHTYSRPGDYTVTVKVSDSDHNSAYMQMVTVVNGPVPKVGATGGQGLAAVGGELVGSWPLFALAVIVVISFWLGERRQMRKIRRQLANSGQ